MRSWTINKDGGDDNVRVLAHEFCQRSRYYFYEWSDRAFDVAWVFRASGITYTESDDYIEWTNTMALIHIVAFNAVLRDRALYPRP